MSDDGRLSGRRPVFSKRWVGNVLRPLPIKYHKRQSSDIRWRLALLSVSAVGAVAAVVCAIIGREALAVRVFAATIIVLGGLLYHALTTRD